MILSVQTPTTQSVQRRSAQSVQRRSAQAVQRRSAQAVQKRSARAVQPVQKTSSAAKAQGFWSKGSIRLAAFLSLSCFFTEIVFKLSVETLHTASSFVFLALFSLCVGLVISGVISLLPKKAMQILISIY